MRAALSLTALLTLTGCFTGAKGRFDYSMAASPNWVVQCVNKECCKQHPWEWANHNQVCQPLTFLGCGNPGPTNGDPEVTQDPTTGRFWYIVMMDAGRLCLSSAPDTDPFVLDRAMIIPQSLFNGADGVDRPQLFVTQNKFGVTNFNEGPPVNGKENGELVTRVFNKADFLAGRSPRTAMIVHGAGDPVGAMPAYVQRGSGGQAAWVRVDSSAVTIGSITGVPGENGGINTASKRIVRSWTYADRDPVPTPIFGTSIQNKSWPRVILRRRPNGNSDLWLVVPIRRHGTTQLQLDHYTGMGPTFDPVLAHTWIIEATGGIVGQSMAVGQGDDRVLLGFTSVSATQWPKLEVVALRLNGQVKRFVFKQEGGPDINGLPRIDYNPVGVSVLIGTDEWLGVGFDHLVPLGPTGEAFEMPVRTGFMCRAPDPTGGDLCTF